MYPYDKKVRCLRCGKEAVTATNRHDIDTAVLYEVHCYCGFGQVLLPARAADVFQELGGLCS